MPPVSENDRFPMGRAGCHGQGLRRSSLSSRLEKRLWRGCSMIGVIRRTSLIRRSRCSPTEPIKLPAATPMAMTPMTCGADPLFKLGLDRKLLDPDADLTSAATFSHLENAATARDVLPSGPGLCRSVRGRLCTSAGADCAGLCWIWIVLLRF